MNVKFVSVFAIVLLSGGTPLVAGGSIITTNYANAKYAQSQANANECDAGTNCAISSPKVQGDGSASSPINLQISNFESHAPSEPAVPAVPEDLAYVVWNDNTPGNTDVLYRQSSEGFAQSTLNLSDNPSESFNPVIAVSGNDVYVVWSDFNSIDSEIMFRKSSDGGVTFDSTVNLSNNKGDSVNPAIAVSGDDVYVIWRDDTGNHEILYRKSTDGGQTFGNIVNLTNTPGNSGGHSIAVSGDNVHIIWSERAPGVVDIRYMKSSDGGDTFGPAQKLNDNFQDSGNPDIAVFGNNVYIVWQEDFPGADEIFYRRSVDGGITFDSIVNFSNSTSGSENPAIAASGNNVYMVWRDFLSENHEIAYRSSTDGGASFGPVKNLSHTPGGSDFPAISTSSNNLYLVWRDSSGTPDEFNTVHADILYRQSIDQGASFGSTMNLSANAGDSDGPDIASTS